MRVALALAAVALLALAAAPLSRSPNAHAQDATVQVGDLYFCDSSYQNGVCETTVSEGDTVQWQWVGSQFHTTTECAGDLDTCPGPHLWDSPAQDAGTFSFTFDTAGTYLYRCQVHPIEMRGQVTVLAATQPTPTPQPSPQSSPAAGTPAAAPGSTITPASVPNGGGAPPHEGGTSSLWLVAAAGGAMLAAGLAAGLRARRR